MGRWLIFLSLFFTLISCQEEPVLANVKSCSSSSSWAVCEINHNLKGVLDTFSHVKFFNDTMETSGRLFLSISDYKSNYELVWNNRMITLSEGIYEVSDNPRHLLKVYSGQATLKTVKNTVNIETGSQLTFISGSHVITSLSEKFPVWLPDSLSYK